MSDITSCQRIYSIATDPIYIGTGGYTIGRVDNTIVRDPITKIPEIPGSSVAGTWRYFVALKLISEIKDYQPDFEDIKNVSLDNEENNNKKSLSDKLKEYNWKNINEANEKDGKSFNKLEDWIKFEGNQIAKITCAGQDNVPTAGIEAPDAKNKEGQTGHCGHCIVCKAFGYSKKDKSWQGMLFFSDLNILFFPVYTRFGVKWISSKRILKAAGLLLNNNFEESTQEIVFVQEKIEEEKEKGYINLGWLNLPYKIEKLNIDLDKVKSKDFELKPQDVIVVSDSLISQIINSNLEVRTSVSIDPITGAAKEGALFTSEAIPRGTIFYGEIRVFDRNNLNNENLPSKEYIWQALEDTKHYYETLGIGGMTTRGFGRMKILTKLRGGKCKEEDNPSGGNGNE